MSSPQERPRQSQQYIDLVESDSESTSLTEVDQEEESDFLDEQDDGVDQQDWAESSGDFTKKYNRLRNHVTIVRDNGSGILPASNQASRLTAASTNASSTSKESTPTHISKVDSALASLSHRYSHQVNLNPLYATNVTGPATRKGGSERILIKDKSDRATNEQVLDDRTRLVLFKMLGRGLLSVVEGCVSTGKEANVYHARAGELVADNALLSHLAIKIYKTSILVFKDRDRYVTGEYRFKGGYSRSNPRKMVRLWAEKELRNLRRLHSAGVRCPEPVEVRENVLVMGFLGRSEDGWQASPRLKDAEIPVDILEPLYIEMLLTMRVIYQQCRLVHADLSEYNIIFHNQHLYIIDVSQSVEHDHPHAFDFLRSDIQNMDEFFGRRGIATLGLRKTFDLVVAQRNDLSSHEQVATEVAALRTQSKTGESEEHAAQDAAVFKQSYIPRTLNEVYDPERDAALVQKGEGDALIYASHTGLASSTPLVSSRLAQGNGHASDSASENDSSPGSRSESDSDTESDGEPIDHIKTPKGKKFEDKDAKKERKQAVREERAEKRKTKMPKGEKKRRVAKTSGKRK